MYKGIIIFGTMGAGKDTLADMLVERIFMGKIFKLGEDIRKIVDNSSPGNDNRKLYQEYGQAVRKTLGIDAWNYICKNKIESAKIIYTLLFPIIADGRQLNEYEYWKEQGFYVIGIETPLETRYERIVKRDGQCDRPRMIHETELQAQFVVSQLAEYIIDNQCSIELLGYLADEIAKIVNK